MPAASVFDYYIANGTAINFTSIPKVQGKSTIMDVVLSPSNNPYGQRREGFLGGGFWVELF